MKARRRKATYRVTGFGKALTVQTSVASYLQDERFVKVDGKWSVRA